MRSTIESPRPSPRATLAPSSSRLNSPKIDLPLRLRNPDAGVVDVDRRARAAPPAADQHAALGRVLDRIGDEVQQQPAQQPPVRAHRERRGDEFELQPLGAGERRKVHLELAEQRVDAQAFDLRLHGAGVEPRDIEQRRENFLHRLERGVDVADQRAIVALVLALDQARHIKPRGVERLQNVVARGRQKPRLGNIGVVGLGLGADQLGIEPLELAGALAHAALERRVGALQRLRGGDARGDVGERGHDAGARHRVAAHLDHQPALGKALQERLVGGGVA